jgi:hypothetical protein
VWFDELVLKSDAVLIATLMSVEEHTEGGIDYGKGRLTVERAVLGELASGSELELQWRNESDAICPRVEHRRHVGVRGMWLVTLKPNGVAHADYPRRFLSLSDSESIRRALAEVHQGMKRTDDRRVMAVLEELEHFASNP